MRVPSIEGHRSEIEKVCKDNNISFLGLFGSYARHENTEESDIDLLIDFYETKSLLEIAHIQNILSDILQKRVDLVLRKALRPRIRPYVMQDLQTIYSSHPVS